MKRIGIITFSNEPNFGASLQCVALFKFIERLCLEENIEVCVIDYISKSMEKKYYSIPVTVARHGFLMKHVTSLCKIFFRFLKKNIFKYWLTKNVRFSARYILDNIKKSDEVFDIFISGSDQVWNVDVTQNDLTYFLDFVQSPKKKYSYAASFGFENSFYDSIDKIKNFLMEFQALSVRENICFENLKKVNQRTFISIDPTLLLTSKEWCSYFNTKNSYKPYVFLYFTDKETDELRECANNISQKYNLNLIKLQTHFLIENGVKNIILAKPSKFLNLIYNASFVVTSSFHGTVFSILFHKKFFTEINNRNVHNYRVESLLDMVGISNKNVNGNIIEVNELVDWDFVDKKIALEQKKTIEYLNNILNI